VKNLFLYDFPYILSLMISYYIIQLYLYSLRKPTRLSPVFFSAYALRLLEVGLVVYTGISISPSSPAACLCLASRPLAAVPRDGSKTTVKAHARTMSQAAAAWWPVGRPPGGALGRMQLMSSWRVAHMRMQCSLPPAYPVAAPAPAHRSLSLRPKVSELHCVAS
jgi:hypothetical protein